MSVEVEVNRLYILTYDDGEREPVWAQSSTAAVAARKRSLLPYNIEDRSATIEWIGRTSGLDIAGAAAMGVTVDEYRRIARSMNGTFPSGDARND